MTDQPANDGKTVTPAAKAAAKKRWTKLRKAIAPKKGDLVETIDPALLTLHPLCKSQPELDPASPEFGAIVEDIRERGIVYPLVIDEQNRIVDGKHRWKCAKRLQLATVPVKRCKSEDAADIVVSQILHRRHYTQSARAYLIVPLCRDILVSSHDRRIAGLKRGKANGTPSDTTIESVAETYGLGAGLLSQAFRLHEIFEKDEASPATDGLIRVPLRQKFEPRILAGEIALGACIAGIGGKNATAGSKKEPHDPLKLSMQLWDTVTIRLALWTKLDEAGREEVLPVLRKAIASAPPEVLKEIEKAVRLAKKETEV